MSKKKILGIPGSLRADSSSNVVLKAIEEIASENFSFEIFSEVGSLPHFNDPKEVPKAIVDFRNRIAQADAILICTPEYAFGIPGSLKNALDWTVGSSDLVDKPVALVTASSQGEKGHAALLLVLTAISAKVPEGGHVVIPFIRSKVKDGKVTDEKTLTEIRNVINSLRKISEI